MGHNDIGVPDDLVDAVGRDRDGVNRADRHLAAGLTIRVDPLARRALAPPADAAHYPVASQLPPSNNQTKLN